MSKATEIQEFTIQFAKLESLLAMFQRIADDKRTKFQARLKNLHRLGFPHDLVTESGRPTEYKAHQYLLMAVALEFLQLGMSPDRTVELMDQFEGTISAGLCAAAHHLQPHAEESRRSDWGPHSKETFYLLFDPAGLSKLITTSGLDFVAAVWLVTGDELSEKIENWSNFASPRLTLINLTSIVRHLMPPIDSRSPLGFEAFHTELQDWGNVQFVQWQQEEGNLDVD